MTNKEHVKLCSALTIYDEKQSTKRGYNPYALAHYMEALRKVEAHTQAGIPLRNAIIGCFNGRLADTLLRVVNLPKMTAEEARFGITLPEPKGV